jgi:hypothetical protein
MEMSKDPLEDKWDCEVAVQKGSKIGATVDLLWQSDKPDLLGVDITEGSKGSAKLAMYSIGTMFFACAISATYDIGPLAFLPGRKLAFLLGGIIGLVLGGIVYAVLKPLFINKEDKQSSNELIQEVAKTLSAYSIV